MKNAILSSILGSILSLILGLSISSAAHAAAAREIPAYQVLSAARSLKSQTGPAYFVSGILSCYSIAREVPPYESTAKCTVVVENKGKSFKPSDELMEVLRDIKPQTGPFCKFEASFNASSLSREFPDYTVSDYAEVEIN